MSRGIDVIRRTRLASGPTDPDHSELVNAAANRRPLAVGRGDYSGLLHRIRRRFRPGSGRPERRPGNPGFMGTVQRCDRCGYCAACGICTDRCECWSPSSTRACWWPRRARWTWSARTAATPAVYSSGWWRGTRPATGAMWTPRTPPPCGPAWPDRPDVV